MRLYRWFMLLGALSAGAFATPTGSAAQALSQPEGWRTRAERFVAMPPGFHITTTPSVLFYHPDARATGEFSVESEGFLFRGEATNTYGLFVGGRDLENDDAAWTSLEIGHEGIWVVRTRVRREGANGAEIVDLAGPSTGPVALPGDEVTAKNVLAIAVGPEQVEFRVNGQTVARLPRADLAVDGVVGFRAGAGLNLHLTTLSISSDGQTTNWAPARAGGGGA